MTIETTILETERLILAPSDPSMAEGVLALHERNQDRFDPVEPTHAADYFTLDYQRRVLEEDARLRREGTACRFWIFEKGSAAPAGNIGVSNIIRGPFCSAFVGYKLDAAHTGRGLMAEALNALISYAFNTLGLHRLEANILPGNHRSLNVAKRAGFANEGLSRKYMEIGGQWRDLVHMVLINDEMPPPKG